MNISRETRDLISLPGLVAMGAIGVGYEMYSYLREEASRLLNPKSRNAVRHFEIGEEEVVERFEGRVLLHRGNKLGLIVKTGKQYLAHRSGLQDMNSHLAGLPNFPPQPPQIKRFYDYIPLNGK